MNIYFVRHGESIGNLTNIYDTATHGKLSENGMKQAEILRDRLGEYKFDLILASPMERAMCTILPYLKHKNLKCEIWGQLAEACWQKDRTAESCDDVPAAEPIVISDEEDTYFKMACDENVLKTHIHREEKYLDGIKRVKYIYEHIMNNYSGLDISILIIGHGLAGSRLIEMFLGIEPVGRFIHCNTGMSLLAQQPNGTFRARYINRL